MTDSGEKGEVILRPHEWNPFSRKAHPQPPLHPPAPERWTHQVPRAPNHTPAFYMTPAIHSNQLKECLHFFFSFLNQSGEAENKEPGRRGLGQGLSSRGIPVGTSKIKVIHLPSSQTGLFSAASCLLKRLFAQSWVFPNPLPKKILNLYKTFLTV